MASAESSSRGRIAYLTYGSGLFDARTYRMAHSAIEAGYEVSVYARWEPGLPLVETLDGYRLVRAPWAWQGAVPGLARLARPRDLAGPRAGSGGAPEVPPEPRREAPREARERPSASGPAVLRPLRAGRQAVNLLRKYPGRPLGWARSLENVAEPADIWHGSWAGTLPALDRLRRRFGGHAIYDSRDIYMESRKLATAPPLLRAGLARLERRWARRMDRVITVNDSYADVLARRFGIPTPTIVLNCPDAWTPPDPPPDLIREALGLPTSTRIVLYQGQLISDRGIEQSMDAILEVPGSALVLLGYGELEARLRAAASAPPYAGRVFVLPAVHPRDLLSWTASADAVLMAIQPTSLNHRFTTPQKLFEAIAAGVPVVASDLPGMAAIVREIDAGLLCDPTSPASIATAVRELLAESPPARAARRARILAAAHDRYNWAAQVAVLHGLYRELLADRAAGAAT